MNPTTKAKLQHFKEFTILHPSYSEALESLHRSIEAADVLGENCGAVLLGDSGTGKSRICHQLTAEYPPASFVKSEDGIQKIMPVVSCLVPNDTTVKSLMARLLREFGAYRPYQNQEALESCLFQTLVSCQTKLLILDEWPHLYRSGTSQAIKNAADFVKVLMDVFNRPVLLVGECETEKIIDLRSALTDRFPYRAYLQPFSLSTPENWNIFSKVLRAYATHLKTEIGFVNIPAFTDEKMVLAFYVATGGNFRGLFNILFAAIMTALSRNDKNLLIDDLAMGCKHVKVSLRLAIENPFEMTIGELKKVITSTRKKKK